VRSPGLCALFLYSEPLGQSFKYVGPAVNQNNTIEEEEIKERVIAGNKAFYANQKML
jgi:hypothetical protein